ncbi:hypothetical protein HK098_005622 [Nowakowskiella sp. JEL0407]|nr:hypothetical protein HK098_005622 [Nowakowskiella sp. JEL0407]
METVTGGLSACCVTGFLDRGVPAGTETKLGSLDCYLARANPSSETPSENAILMLSDAFGWKLNNARLVADAYANEGFDCYLPDFHSGSSISTELLSTSTGSSSLFSSVQLVFKYVKAMPSLLSWLPAHNPEVTFPLLDIALTELREKIGVKKLAAFGYCWGGRYAILLGGANPKVEAVVAFHPSLVQFPKDVEEIKVPSSFQLAESDVFFSSARVSQTETILKTNLEKYEVVLYKGTSHGFSMRGNEMYELIKKARDDAHARAITFIKSGVPTGIETKLGSLDCYIARASPSSNTPSENAILMISDAFGWKLNNARLVADAYANEGFDCYLPDFHSGTSISVELMSNLTGSSSFMEKTNFVLKYVKAIPTLIAWMPKHSPKITCALLDLAITELRENIGVKKLVAFGYCWGGRYAIILGGQNVEFFDFLSIELINVCVIFHGQAKVDAISVFHPSMVAFPKEVEAIKVPCSFQLAESDMYFSFARISQTKTILKTNLEKYEVVVYKETSHGFSMRGNEMEEVVKKARDDSHASAIAFIKTVLNA